MLFAVHLTGGLPCVMDDLIDFHARPVVGRDDERAIGILCIPWPMVSGARRASATSWTRPGRPDA